MTAKTWLKVVILTIFFTVPIAMFLFLTSNSNPNPEEEETNLKLDLGQKAFLTQQTNYVLKVQHITDLPPDYILATAAMCTDFGSDSSLVANNNFFYIEYDSTDALTKSLTDGWHFYDHGVKLCSYSSPDRCYIHFVSKLWEQDVNNADFPGDLTRATNNPEWWLGRAGYGTWVYDKYPEIRTWFASNDNKD